MYFSSALPVIEVPLQSTTGRSSIHRFKSKTDCFVNLSFESDESVGCWSSSLHSSVALYKVRGFRWLGQARALHCERRREAKRKADVDVHVLLVLVRGKNTGLSQKKAQKRQTRKPTRLNHVGDAVSCTMIRRLPRTTHLHACVQSKGHVRPRRREVGNAGSATPVKPSRSRVR